MTIESEIADVDRVPTIVPVSPLAVSMPLYVPPGGVCNDDATRCEASLHQADLEEVVRALQRVDAAPIRLKPGCALACCCAAAAVLAHALA